MTRGIKATRAEQSSGSESTSGEVSGIRSLGTLADLISHLNQAIPLGGYRDAFARLTIALMKNYRDAFLHSLLEFSTRTGKIVHFLDEKYGAIELTATGLQTISTRMDKMRCWQTLILDSQHQFREISNIRDGDRKGVARVNFEFWQLSEGYYRTENLNMYARRIPEDYARDKGFLSEPRQLFDFAKLHSNPVDCENTFPIDIVYTWVNDQDPNWQKMFEATSGRSWADGKARDRYRSREELRYSLRSVHAFVPWVHRIFVVSNCAPPKWLNVQHEKVVWVDHSEIFAADCLPTFNSHAIEASLHKIPGLSEQFLYLNDDFFFGRLQKAQTYFQSNGVSLSFLENYGTVVGRLQDATHEYMNAARNGKELMEHRFGVSPTQLHLHVPYGLRKSVLGSICSEFAEPIARTQSSRFRSITDVSVPSFLYHHYAFQERFAARSDLYASRLIKFTNPDYRARMKKLLDKRDCDAFCINDGAGSAESADWNNAVSAFLHAYFPEKSPYEI